MFNNQMLFKCCSNTTPLKFILAKTLIPLVLYLSLLIIIVQVRDCVDKYSHIFVYSVENMRNNKLKEVCCECLCVVDLFLIALLF